MTIFRISIYKPNVFGHGGEKRSAQIEQLLSVNGYEVTDIVLENKTKPGIQFVLSLPAIILKIIRYFPLSAFKNTRYLLLCAKRYYLFQVALDKAGFKEGDMVIWESTRSLYNTIPIILKRKNVRIIAISHNIESIVPGQKSVLSGKSSPDWLQEELQYLNICDAVFCISKEDTFFLKFHGIKSHYLPYYPGSDTINDLLLVRQKRKKKSANNKAKKILMLGSADNQPTRIGFLNRIDFFKKNNLPDVEVIIAGFKTEQLLNEIDVLPKNIKLMGSLSTNDLSSLLEEIDALLIHQPVTSGALTRILEALYAGIPVIANFDSTRDYFNVDGLFHYVDDRGMIELLNSSGISMPDIPQEKEIYSKFFVNTLKSFQVV